MTITLQDRAVQLGAWIWLERRLFEVVGSWVGSTDDDALTYCFAAHSRRHGFRAALLTEHLPTVYVPPVDDLLTAPVEAAVIESMAGLSGTVERAAALYRFAHPRQLTTYAICIGTAVAFTDGPLLRTLRLVADDLDRDWLEGEMSLQRVLRGTDDVDRLVRVVGDMEKGLVKAHLSGSPHASFWR